MDGGEVGRRTMCMDMSKASPVSPIPAREEHPASKVLLPCNPSVQVPFVEMYKKNSQNSKMEFHSSDQDLKRILQTILSDLLGIKYQSHYMHTGLQP